MMQYLYLIPAVSATQTVRQVSVYRFKDIMGEVEKDSVNCGMTPALGIVLQDHADGVQISPRPLPELQR